ncbi:hypothetical protein D3C76_336080 [compost metagenome]
MNKAELIKDTKYALELLENEHDKCGGFDEYPQFCEEMLKEIIPQLSNKTLQHVKNKALKECNLI